eukprot:1237403-Prymnesium_polylepis.2
MRARHDVVGASASRSGADLIRLRQSPVTLPQLLARRESYTVRAGSAHAKYGNGEEGRCRSLAL